ncbi:hypothetical protein HI914_00738 [Erysiphe necator]|nr:hypothetical protein HI914_00738 [Erysiphe necator]
MESKVHRADLHTPPLVALSCLKSENELIQRLTTIYGPITTYSTSRRLADGATSGTSLVPSTTCQKPPLLKNDCSAVSKTTKDLVASETEYNFYLFRNSRESSPQKVILEQEQLHLLDDGLNDKQGGFLVSQRKISYYFTPPASKGYKEQLVLSAVEGETVKQWSTQRAWGLEVPWRVQILRTQISAYKEVPKAYSNNGQENINVSIESNTPTSSEILQAQFQTQESCKSNKRRKPSKKRRIAVRKKLRAILALEEQQMQMKELKAQALKEKKIRRNREKKIKRKIKKKKEKEVLVDTNKI